MISESEKDFNKSGKPLLNVSKIELSPPNTPSKDLPTLVKDLRNLIRYSMVIKYIINSIIFSKSTVVNNFFTVFHILVITFPIEADGYWLTIIPINKINEIKELGAN